MVAVDPTGEHVRVLGFDDLARVSNRGANLLAAHGVGKGDRVFVMLPRVPAWHEVVLACVKLGAVPMPGTTLLTAKDIAYRVAKADASVAVTDAEGLPRVVEAAKECPSLRLLITVDESGPRRLGELAFGARVGHGCAARGRADAGGRPAADLLHVRHDRLPEDGAAHAGLLRAGTRDHRALLAGSRARRPALDRLGHRLGQGRVGEAVRSVADGCGGLPVGRAGQARLRADAPAGGGAWRHDLLRAAHGLPLLRPDGSRELRPRVAPPRGLRRRAPEPRGDRAVARRHRAHDLRRVWPDRNGEPGRQLPVRARARGIDGQAHARLRRRDHRRGRERARAGRGGAHHGAGASRAAGRALPGVLAGSRRHRRGVQRGSLLHRGPGPGGRATATCGSSAATTT